MNYKIGKIMVAAIFVAAVGVQTKAETRSKSIIVESASDLPEIAQRKGDAMYLRETGGGQTFLYIEQDNGQTLAVLDVTDLSAIRPVAKVSLPAKSSYDFVEALTDSSALVHYRDHSGFGVINFKKAKMPVLTEAPQFEHPSQAESVGRAGLLLTSMNHPINQAPDPQFEVFDVSNPSNPRRLATVDGVTQRLDREETGTIFVLGNNGLTVVRRPHVEQEYELETNYTN